MEFLLTLPFPLPLYPSPATSIDHGGEEGEEESSCFSNFAKSSRACGFEITRMGSSILMHLLVGEGILYSPQGG